MNLIRKPIGAVILCAGVLLGGSVAARFPASADAGEPDGEGAATGIASRIGADQLRLLYEALGRYRDIQRRGGWGTFTSDLVMGPGYAYDCSSIAALERRLVVEGYLSRPSSGPPRPPRPAVANPAGTEPPPPPAQTQRCEYGPALTAAMRAFQSDRKVIGIGQAGTKTQAELNRPVEEIVRILERDVARWRNIALDPHGTYLLVNIPFFELLVFEDGRESMRMPVIVGQRTWQTPLFSDEVESLIVNPDWGIPDSIAKQEIWPIAKRDPGYFRRQGITATGGSLRQKPGPRNPLGRIKFLLPNEHDVYLHDTPEQRAFTAAVRALSHGCIRLSRPIELAHWILRDDPHWGARRLEAAIGSGRTQQIRLSQPVPVHIIYSTSRVNEDGRVELRPDVYGKN